MARAAWVRLYIVAGAANRLRVVPEEARRAEAQRLAMMAVLALRPQEAQTRIWEAQIPADVDAPMRQVNDALAQMRPREAFARANQPGNSWAPILGYPFE